MVTLLSQLKNNLEKELNIIILCAGKGTRIQKKYPSLPKTLIKVKEFNNKPILEIILDSVLKTEEINQAWVVTGYLGEKIKSFIARFTANNQLKAKKIRLINATQNYEKGPLFSLLDVAFNYQLAKNQIYLTIPGDTIFEEALLAPILNTITNHYQFQSNTSVIFYRELDKDHIQELDGSKERIKIVNTVEFNDSGVFYELLEKISEISTKSVLEDKPIKQLLPFFALDYDFFMHLAEIAPKMAIKTIYSALNELNQEYKIQAYKIESEGSFFDIDTEEDLKNLNKKKKGGQ